jgi:hypothetical protein
LSAKTIHAFSCDFCGARGEGREDYPGSDIIYLPEGWTSYAIDHRQSAEEVVFHACPAAAHHEQITIGYLLRARETRREMRRRSAPRRP